MKKPRPALLSTVLIAAAVGAAGLAPAAEAITRKQANRTALQVLAPQSDNGQIVVFGLPKPLSAQTAVSEATPKKRSKLGKRLGRKMWLFWEDLAHGAMFAHAGVMLLIDDRTGRARKPRSTTWQPLVNGRPPAFLRSDRAYNGSRYRIFSNFEAKGPASPRLPVAGGLARAGGPLATAAQTGNPPIDEREVANDCLITIGDRGPGHDTNRGRETGQDLNNAGDGKLSRNFDAMNAFADSIGLPKFEAGASPAELEAKIEEALAKGCIDVFIFLAGHGVPPPGTHRAGNQEVESAGGDPGIVVRNRVVEKGGEKVQEVGLITPDDLKKIMDRFLGRATFKLKILACFAGRFAPTLSGQRNLSPIELSAAANETSWLHRKRSIRSVDPPVIVENTIENPREIADFVNRNVRGLQSWAQNPQKRDLRSGIAQSFTDGAPFDFSASVQDTHPELEEKPVQEVPPPSSRCVGPEKLIYDNWNTRGVKNGGTPPTFSTDGKTYCLTQIATYHWNAGRGARPGRISLTGHGYTLGPFQVSGGAGGSLPRDWIALVPTSPRPTFINGTYTCRDSNPATWSQNKRSGGRGFCKVFGREATPAGGG